MSRKSNLCNTAKFMLGCFMGILLVLLIAMATDLYLGVWLETNCASTDGVCG